MGYRRKTDHHTESRIGQIRFEVLFSVQWPASAIGQKFGIINMAITLQNAVRVPETENVTVEHLETFLTHSAKEKFAIMTEISKKYEMPLLDRTTGGGQGRSASQWITVRQKSLTELPCARALALHEKPLPILSRISTESVEMLERLQ